MIQKYLDTAGIITLLFQIKGAQTIEHSSLIELHDLILSNDKLKEDFIHMLFRYNGHSLWVEMLNMMADNNIISPTEANYNNTGKYKIQ